MEKRRVGPVAAEKLLSGPQQRPRLVIRGVEESCTLCEVDGGGYRNLNELSDGRRAPHRRPQGRTRGYKAGQQNKVVLFPPQSLGLRLHFFVCPFKGFRC